MKYAFFPGCVSRGGAPELYQSVMHVCRRLGIELEEMTSASCTGAGVLQEKNRKLGDALNARNFALAEQLGLPIMTICSTCQGVMSQANKRLRDDPDYLAEINEVLAEEKLEYKGTTDVKHLLWVLLEDIGEEELKRHMIFPLTELRIAPFYGCYILRPSDALGFDENPQRQQSLETIISLVGAEVVDFPGKTKCCGFPILTINERNSLRMVAKHTGDAKDLGADAMVTPCPLCHLNLDGFQPKAARQNSRKIDLPIIHLPQMIGLAMGMDGDTMGMRKHIISPKKILAKTGIPT
jgi:succinate dehydrogenase / fumarate reductase cytochrome b subunit